MEENIILYVEESDENQPCGERRRTEWSDSQTKLLIQLYEENYRKVGKIKKFSSFQKLFAFISEQLRNYGYEVSSSQVKTKWDSLSRAYKDVIANNNKSGAKRKTCQFEELTVLYLNIYDISNFYIFRQLHEIFKRRRSVYPVVLADGSNSMIVQHTENNNTPQIVNEPSKTASSEVDCSASNIAATSSNKISVRKSTMQINIELRNQQHKEKIKFLREIHDEKMQLKKEIAEQKAKDRAELLKIMKEKLIQKNE